MSVTHQRFASLLVWDAARYASARSVAVEKSAKATDDPSYKKDIVSLTNSAKVLHVHTMRLTISLDDELRAGEGDEGSEGKAMTRNRLLNQGQGPVYVMRYFVCALPFLGLFSTVSSSACII